MMLGERDKLSSDLLGMGGEHSRFMGPAATSALSPLTTSKAESRAVNPCLQFLAQRPQPKVVGMESYEEKLAHLRTLSQAERRKARVPGGYNESALRDRNWAEFLSCITLDLDGGS